MKHFLKIFFLKMAFFSKSISCNYFYKIEVRLREDHWRHLDWFEWQRRRGHVEMGNGQLFTDSAVNMTTVFFSAAWKWKPQVLVIKPGRYGCWNSLPNCFPGSGQKTSLITETSRKSGAKKTACTLTWPQRNGMIGGATAPWNSCVKKWLSIFPL